MKEYIDLPTMGDVWKAKEEGLVIEELRSAGDIQGWVPWSGAWWSGGCIYRAIKPLPEYYSFKKDEKVMYGGDKNELYEGHFSHVDEYGRPHVFKDGRTSWTSYVTYPWPVCRRPTKEELGE